VEILVVISIIALLLSLLVPSMKSAREQARLVVCGSHQSAIGRAAAAYATQWNGWLCGSPGTSGSVMYLEPRPEPESEDFDCDPVQIWDWAGPLAGGYMSMSLPANRAERFGVLVEGVFACPNNRYEADPHRKATGSFGRQKMVSYNTFRNFLSWSRTMVTWDGFRPWGGPAPFLEASFDRIGGRTLPPVNYVPRMGQITNPSGKAYLADGNRFTGADGSVTYDTDWDALAGGAFCNGGPTLRVHDGIKLVLSAYHYDRGLGARGYRHRIKGQRGLVVSHFDGHAEFVTETESRKPDRWWPKGTVISFTDFNEASLKHLVGRFDRDFNYVVGR